MSATNTRLKTPNADTSTHEENLWDRKSLPSPKEVKWSCMFILKLNNNKKMCSFTKKKLKHSFKMGK